MKRKNHLMFYLTLLICAIMPLGFASFDVLAGETSQATPTLDDDVTKVCYNDTTNKQYTTIEMALKEANNGETIYVIPNTNPIISYACEVKEGVTLTFPYNGTDYYNSSTIDNQDSDSNYYYQSGFSDYQNSTYCQNTVIIKKVVNQLNEIVPTITVSGTINVGGYRGSSKVQGGTAGKHVTLILENDALIKLTGGTLNCYGYIKESSDNNNSLIIAESGSTIFEPVVVYDWSNATNNGGLVLKKIFPFNIFDLPQVSPQLKIFSGANLIGSIWIYGSNAKDSKADLTLIGTGDNALIKPNSMNNQTYILWKNTDTSEGNFITKNHDKHKANVDLYGNYTLGYVKLTLTYTLIFFQQSIDIDTRNLSLPFSYIFDICLKENSSFDIAYSVKFLPGSKLTIEESAQAKITSTGSVMVYDSNKNASGETIRSYSNNVPSEFINNGKLIIDGNFGGNIITNLVNNDSNSYISTSNLTTFSSSEGNSNFDKIEFSYPATCLIKENDTISVRNLNSNSYYLHFSDFESGIGYWQINTNTVNVIFMDTDGQELNRIIKITGSTITEDDFPTNNLSLSDYQINDDGSLTTYDLNFINWYIEGDNPFNAVNSYYIDFDVQPNSNIIFYPNFEKSEGTESLFYKLTISITFKYAGLISKTQKTNCNIIIDECYVITNNTISKYKNLSIAEETSGNVYYLKDKDKVTLNYNGTPKSGWLSSEYRIEIEFTNFDNNKPVNTSGSVENDSRYINNNNATIVVS